MSRALAAVIVGLAALPGAARAERIGVIALAGADPPIGPAELVRLVAAALARPDVVVIADVAELAAARRAAGAVPAARLEPLGRAEALLHQGWRAYLEARPADAAARLAEARALASGAVDLDGGAALVAEASLRLGAALLALGRDAEAAAQLEDAARLAPGRLVSDAEFKPAVVAAFERARASAPRAPAPVALATPVPPRLQVGLGAGAAGRALAALIEDAELDGVWLVAPAWRGGEVAILGQRCGGAPAPTCTPVAELRVADRGRLATAVAAVLRAGHQRRAIAVTLPADARLIAGEPRTVQPPATGPRWREPWLWAGASAAVFATVAAVVWITVDDGEPARPVIGGDGGDWRR